MNTDQNLNGWYDNVAAWRREYWTLGRLQLFVDAAVIEVHRRHDDLVHPFGFFEDYKLTEANGTGSGAEVGKQMSGLTSAATKEI